ncbi:MAG: hypothetical protein CO161_04810, partial [Candidatus Portnoybacteria bacterium CG_4_9_14_3_um_filter_44_9]
FAYFAVGAFAATPQLYITPSSGNRGTLFSYVGVGFTPNRVIIETIVKPDGTSYPQNYYYANSFGAYTRAYNSSNSSMVGTFTISWQDDATKQKTTAYQTITAAPAPAITSISPNPVPAINASQWVTINGSGFVSGLRIILRTGSEVYTIPITSAGWVNSTQVKIYPNLTATPASWTVQAVNPDNQQSNMFSFSVTATCTPNWQTGSWSTCINGQQTRTVTDSNNCGTTTNKPATTQSCTVACTPNWSCTGFGICANGQQTRTCTDTNNCGVMTGRPSLTQSCVTQSPAPPPAQISNYSINPRAVKRGESAVLQLSVTNTGSSQWIFYVTTSLRKPDNTTIDLSLIPLSLNAGQQGNASWTYSFDTEGNWDVVFGVWQESGKVNSLGYAGWLNDYVTVSAPTTTPPPLPNAPTNTYASAGTDRIAVAWADNSSNENGFRIEKKAGTNGIYSEIATTGVNIALYVDFSVSAGTTYCYRVRAYNTAGNSSYSNELCATIQTATCTPNWQTGLWGTCTNGQQTRTVTDSNNCGITANKPATIQSCTFTCTPNWSCTGFGTCTNNQQTRTCTDTNNCGVTTGKPGLTQLCVIQSPTLTYENPVCLSVGPAVRLNWTASTGATSYTVYRNGSLYANVLVTDLTFYNSANVIAGQTYTYYVQAKNAAGSTNSNTVTVTIPANICGSTILPIYPKPTAKISANSLSIPYNSQVKITWSSTNATSCTVSPTNWIGTSGSKTETLTASKTYTLNCSGQGGSASDSVAVAIESTTPQRTPVVIVPGIMGSNLGSQIDKQLWPGFLSGEGWRSALSRLFAPSEKLDLYENGLSKEDIFPTGIIETTPNLYSIYKIKQDTDIFETLIKTLKDNGYEEGVDLFFAPYDWRINIISSADSLRKKIEEALIMANAKRITKATKVDIIAHSMGGLLAKYYISGYGKGKVRKFIDIGTPHLGAPKAAAILLYGRNPILDFDIFFYRERIKEFSRNSPSVYQLLPSKNYFVPDSKDYNYYVSNNNPLDYQQTIDFLKNSGANKRLEEWSNLLNDSRLNQWNGANYGVEKVVNIVGCGVDTIGKISIPNPLIANISSALRPNYTYIDGDGTVPLRSAEGGATALNADATYYVVGGKHGELPSTNGVPALIVSLLGEPQIPASNKITISNNITRDVQQCANKKKENVNNSTLPTPIESINSDATHI